MMQNYYTITNVHILIVYIGEKEELQQNRCIAVLYPIYKKNDPQIHNNYRRVALLNIAYKILSYCVFDKIKSLAEKFLGDFQYSFKYNRSTTNLFSIFNTSQILEKSWEFNKSVSFFFWILKKI